MHVQLSALSLCCIHTVQKQLIQGYCSWNNGNRFVCKSLYAQRTEQGESYSPVKCRKKVNKTFIMIKNEPLIFINWQLGPWCYFCEALVILIHSWRHSSSTLSLWTSLWKYNSGYDLWLWLLTLQAWNKHILGDMVAKPFTPVSPTGGRNSCRHSGFQVLCSCRGYVIFHNQPEGSQVLASSLSSGLLNVSGSFTEGWHQEAHGSGCCVWV